MHFKIISGALIVLIAVASRWSNSNSTTFWLYLTRANKRESQSSKLYFVQVILVAISSIMVWLTTSHRSQNRELHSLHQLINWSVAGAAMVLPLFSPPSVLPRLTSIFLGFAPSFLLLSIGYEAVFYSAFAMVLIGWIFVESANLYSLEESGSARRGSLVDSSVFGYEERHLQLSDLRIPLLFVILFNVAFFGTGNFASIASFEISSVYRFITVFSPFLMAGLLIFKLFIPFMLVICTFSAITKVVRIPRLGCYFLVILLSDVMTIHFFFLDMSVGTSWNILRPETVESLMYLWRLTGNKTYQDWGWDIFQAFEKNSRIESGYVGLRDVNTGEKDNMMQSFFLAETLKYLYLLFSPPSVISFDEWVFNTEAHPLRIVPVHDNKGNGTPVRPFGRKQGKPE
nr:unnamed protein product [Digitaria exilis]